MVNVTKADFQKWNPDTLQIYFNVYKSRRFSLLYFTVSSTTGCPEIREHSVMKHSP